MRTLSILTTQKETKSTFGSDGVFVKIGKNKRSKALDFLWKRKIHEKVWWSPLADLGLCAAGFEGGSTIVFFFWFMRPTTRLCARIWFKPKSNILFFTWVLRSQSEYSSKLIFNWDLGFASNEIVFWVITIQGCCWWCLFEKMIMVVRKMNVMWRRTYGRRRWKYEERGNVGFFPSLLYFFFLIN